MGNVVCQTLHNLCQPSALKYPLGLINPREAPLALAQRVFDDLELSVDYGAPSVQSAHALRFNAWTACAKGDVVLVTLNGARPLKAGWIWKHVAVPAVEDAARYGCLHMSLMQLGTLQWHDADICLASWELDDDPEWVECSDIVDVCIFSWEGSRSIRTLLPRRCRDL